jgi:hypothetical protein
MKRNIILLVILIALYFGTSFVLNLVYGDSFPFLAGEDFWESDGHGGWVEHGHPNSEMPVEPSVNFPILIYYLPVFIPALVLFLFLFTPLGKLLESSSDEAIEDDKESVDTGTN